MDWKQYAIQTAVTLAVFIIYACAVGMLLDRIANAFFRKGGRKLIRATYIGVIHHELSHALIAALTGAKVTEISLFRIFRTDNKLGYVRFTPRGLPPMQAMQTVLTSLAPALLGTLNIYLLGFYAFPAVGIVGKVLLGYLMFSIFLHMSLSMQDIVNVLTKMFFPLIFLYAVFFGFGINLLMLFGEAEKVLPIKLLIEYLSSSK